MGITYLGNSNLYGSYEMQEVTPNGVVSEFNLNFKVGTPNQLLVVLDGVVQQAGAGNAYTINNNGSKILFSTVPPNLSTLYWIFLGVQLTVGKVEGIEPVYQTETGDGSTTDFTLTAGPVDIDSIIVFVDKVLQRPLADFLLSGNQIQIIVPPSNGALIDFYIHGVERTAIENTLTRTENDFNTFPYKAVPVGNDIILIEDSADSFNKKKIIVGNLPGGGGSSQVDSEIPTGDVDGVNAIFTLAFTYVPGTVKLYHNGLRLTPGGSYDYTETIGNTVTLNFAPEIGDSLLCDYRI